MMNKPVWHLILYRSFRCTEHQLDRKSSFTVIDQVHRGLVNRGLANRVSNTMWDTVAGMKGDILRAIKDE